MNKTISIIPNRYIALLIFAVVFVQRPIKAVAQYKLSEKRNLILTINGPQGIKLKNINAKVFNSKDTIYADSICQNEFYFKNLPATYQGAMHAWAIANGFEEVMDTINIKLGETRHKTLTLKNREIRLKTVTVKGHAPAMIYRGDTLQFHPSAINILDGDMARDILGQMPGVKIDGERINVLGHDIEKTYVDGKSIFGDKPMTAFDHVEGTDVVHIKAYEDKQNKRVKRNKLRPDWVLNIITKSKMINSKDAKLLAAIGKTIDNSPEQTHDLRGAAGGVANFFSEELLFTVNLMHNNENIPTTNSLRFLQIDRARPQYSENSCAGINLDRKWKRKKGLQRLATSYLLTRTSTENAQTEEREYDLSDSYLQRSLMNKQDQMSRNNVHEFSIAFDIGIGNNHTLNALVKQNIENRHSSNTQQIAETTDGLLSQGNIINYQRQQEDATMATISYFGNLRKWIVNAAIDFNRGFAGNEEERMNVFSGKKTTLTTSEQIYIPGHTGTQKQSVTATARREFGRDKLLQGLNVSYVFNHRREHIRQRAFNMLTQQTDSVNTYDFLNHQTGSHAELELFFNMKVFLATISSKLKTDVINDDRLDFYNRVHYDFNRFEGRIDLQRHLGKSNRPLSNKGLVSFTYETTTNLPNLPQLRMQTNNINPFFIHTGNPLLRPERYHTLQTMNSIMLNNRGRMFNLTASVSFIQNCIVSHTRYYANSTYLPSIGIQTVAGSSVSTYENVNGGVTSLVLSDIIWPITSLKSSITANFNLNYNYSPYYFNEQKDYTRNISPEWGVFISTNAIANTRITLRNTISLNIASAKYSAFKNKFFNEKLGIAAEHNFPNSFFAKAVYQLNWQHHRTQHRIERENMLNIYAGKRVFNGKGEISITAYDILNSFNSNIIRVEQNYTLRRNTTNYGRFVSLNFTWTFRKLKSARFDLGNGIDWK